MSKSTRVDLSVCLNIKGVIPITSFVEKFYTQQRFKQRLSNPEHTV